MIKTKNILGTVIIAIVLFLSFSANTFAAETAVDRYTASADVVYEKGEKACGPSKAISLI